MKHGAIAKIQEEMEKLKTNPLVQVLGKYLLVQCEANEEVAESVVKNEKTLDDLAKHITAYAKKKATNGMAMLPDEEVYAQALKFYGSKVGVTKSTKHVTELPKSITPKPKNVTKPKASKLEEGQVTFFDFGMGV